MRNFRSIIVTICSLAAFGFSFSSIAAHDEYRYSDDYEYYSDVYNSRLGTECDFSSISVGMGNVRNGVVVTIDSLDEGVTRCIKKSSWISYFSSFGNSVSVEISNTTLGVQITATSTNSEVATNLKNTQWPRLLSGRSPTYLSSQYSNRITRTIPRYNPYRRGNSNSQYQQPYYQYPQYNYPPQTRSYTAGSSLFNTYQMYRTLSYQTNGVKITLSSPDYNTSRALQSYYYTGLFRDFTGVSVSVVNISGGVEVTVTSGSSSTVEQIQKIGYALVYN